MMRLYPESALTQLEFDKVKDLLAALCNTDFSKQKALQLRIHTRKDFIDRDSTATTIFSSRFYGQY
jgi:DNA mismatch repair protein MutS2